MSDEFPRRSVCSFGDESWIWEMGHLYALMDYAKEAGVEHCFVHGILDGEDAPTGVYA